MEIKKILITGSNKGIGFEIAKQLGEKGHEIFLTARNKEAGEKAASKLKEKGIKVNFIQLDITSQESIDAAFEKFKEHSDSLDILINNAGIMQDRNGILSMTKDNFYETLTTNTLGPILIMQKFMPIICKDGRIINLSSTLGSLKFMRNYSPAYSISKTALNAVTKQFAAALSDRNISVNSMCPGWVRTDLGGPNAELPVEQGADTAVWLALEAPQSYTGMFFKNRNSLDW